MKFIDLHTCPWQHHRRRRPQAGPRSRTAPPALLEQWHAVRAHWPQDLPVAIGIPQRRRHQPARARPRPHCAGRARLPQVDRWPRLLLRHVLRARFKFRAPSARGEVLVDMMQLLQRTGFNEVVLRGDQSRDLCAKGARPVQRRRPLPGRCGGDAAVVPSSARHEVVGDTPATRAAGPLPSRPAIPSGIGRRTDGRGAT